MHQGKQLLSKKDLILYLTNLHLTEKKVDSFVFKNEFNLSSKTFSRYISDIKNVLFDFGLYHIDIFYDREKKLFVCNSK